MNIYKTIMVGGCISLLLAPLLLCIALMIAQQRVKYERRALLKHTSLETLVLLPHQIIWEKKNKELKINGHFFDVKSMKDSAGKRYIKGVYDIAEDVMEAYLSQIPDNSHKSDALSALTSMFSFFLSQAIASSFEKAAPIFNACIKHRDHYLMPSSLAIVTVPSPPPK